MSTVSAPYPDKGQPEKAIDSPPGQLYSPDGAQHPPAGAQYPPGGAPYPPGGSYPPPPPGSYAQPGYPGQGQTTVVINSQVMNAMREIPVRTVCPHCSQEVTTVTTYETGLLTWIICGILLLFGCILGCCLIPFCLTSCKDVVHSCPNCKQVVGRYKRM